MFDGKAGRVFVASTPFSSNRNRPMIFPDIYNDYFPSLSCGGKLIFSKNFFS
jgi:hypothetical protein